MKRKIRLLQLIDRLGFAGAEGLLRTFAAGFDRSRFDLHIFSLRPGLPGVTESVRALGLPVTELDQHHSYDLSVLLMLARYIRRNRIDIIHTHLLAADITGRLAGFITRCPVVSTIHNARVDLDKDPLHLQWMERLSAHLWCRRLIVVSSLLRNEIAEWFRVPKSKVIAIPNGVDLDRFGPQPGLDTSSIRRELLGGDYRMVSNIARLVPQKGQSYLIEAAAQVTATRPDVRFALVGDGPLEGEIIEQAAALGIADKIVLTGVRNDVPAILAATDLFVLSSLWEGMPVSLVEAMAAGCPAVATNVGGVAQLITQGVTGLLVPPADPDALASAIAECLDHPDEAWQRSQNALALVHADYDKNVMIRKWEAVYLRELGLQRKT